MQDREPRCASVSVAQLLLLVEKRHENSMLGYIYIHIYIYTYICIWYHVATPPTKPTAQEIQILIDVSSSDVSFIWKGILHTYNHDLFLSKNTTYTQGFYFIVMLFFVLLHEFQSNTSLPCEGGFSHTCTNIFFKEYHKHCLKGFLSQRILRPLFSRHVLLYSMKFCKK